MLDCALWTMGIPCPCPCKAFGLPSRPMELVPVLRPLFPISGILVIHSVIVHALSKDAKACTRPYIIGLCLMELTLLSSLMSSIAPYDDLIIAWNMLLVVCRSLLCPCWLWMALDVSGIKPLGLDARRIFSLVLVPVLVFAIILFANPLLQWYWPSLHFEGRILVVERSLLPMINIVFCQVLLLFGSIAYAVGLLRHQGNERFRLIVLAVAYSFLFMGDWLYMLGVPLPRNINPQSFFMTIGFYAVGLSVAFFGFPRVRGPITSHDIEAMPPLSLTASPASAPPSFPAPNMLSERQIAILRGVMAGRSYKHIASRLGITERTVKYHMGQILDKCGLETREQLIAWAARSLPIG